MRSNLKMWRVPIGNCIGEEDKGWTYAKALLAHERTAIAGVADCNRELGLVKEYASREFEGVSHRYKIPISKGVSLRLKPNLWALEYTELRVLASVAAGGSPGAESSILKSKAQNVNRLYKL